MKSSRVLPLALTALAFALTTAGAFLPLFRTEQPVGMDGLSGTMRTVQGPWRTVMSFPGQEDLSAATVPLGIPLLLSAALLLAATVLGLRQAGVTANRTTLIAAAFLAGTVCTVAMQGAARLFRDDFPPAQTTPMPGLWLLLAALPAAAAAAVLTIRRQATERPEWADPAVAFTDTATPPSGVVITVLPPEDD